jgi:hypothetical protein
MKRAYILILVGAIAFAAGCQSNPFKKEPPAPPPDLELEGEEARVSDSPALPEEGLKLSSQQRFSDVPLPEGVKEDAERTFVYEAPGLQIGRMVYTLRASASDLAQFYIRECPTAGWQLDSVVQADVVTLNFMKPDKKLRVSIEDLGITRGTELVLLLVPDESSS